MFKGEKTTVFWMGLAVLGYSIFQFCNAAWQIIYYTFLYGMSLPGVTASYASSFARGLVLEAGVPGIMAGVIFLIIALIIMRVGTKKKQTLIQQPEQVQKAT